MQQISTALAPVTRIVVILFVTVSLYACGDTGDVDPVQDSGATPPDADSDTGVEEDIGDECSSDHEEVCEAVCVNTDVDSDHCGLCDNACEENEICDEGECVCDDGYFDCAGECKPVDSSYDECGGECVDTSANHDHCGVCGEPCGELQVCSEGSCEDDCPSGQNVCDGACFDLDTSDDHCGECDNDCPDNGFCDGDSECVCDEGFAGEDCAPIDHCADETDSCHDDAECEYDGPGEYACECDSGFTGDGQSCEPQSCDLPWGGTIEHGESTTAYEFDEVGCEENCPPETRTCSYGVLSGSYQYESCDAPCDDCGSTTLSWDSCEGAVSSANHSESESTDNDADGYEGNATFQCDDGNWDLSSSSCDPIDHCADGTDSCNENATCSYEGPGDYSCECDDGYEGDGFSCEPINPCDNDPCEEDEECEYDGPGEYSCTCPTPECGDAECGMVTTACGTFKDCGGCSGDGEVCDDEDQDETNQCVCDSGSGYESCDNQCVEDSFYVDNDDHCGSCNNACTGDESCFGDTCLECEDDDDCSGDDLCNESNECVAVDCLDDSHCSGDESCTDDNECVECTSNSDCSEYEHCASGGQCETPDYNSNCDDYGNPNRDDSSCFDETKGEPDEGWHCDPDTGECCPHEDSGTTSSIDIEEQDDLDKLTQYCRATTVNIVPENGHIHLSQGESEIEHINRSLRIVFERNGNFVWGSDLSLFEDMKKIGTDGSQVSSLFLDGHENMQVSSVEGMDSLESIENTGWSIQVRYFSSDTTFYDGTTDPFPELSHVGGDVVMQNNDFDSCEVYEWCADTGHCDPEDTSGVTASDCS